MFIILNYQNNWLIYNMNKYLAEFYGTFLLLVAITGTFHLLNNVLNAPSYLTVLSIAISVGAILYTNITIFMNVSGAHFNPAVTLMMHLRGKINQIDSLLYILLQILGGILGVIVTHVMFGENIISLSDVDRSSNNLIVAELLATTGLLIVIAVAEKNNPKKIPSTVGLFIVSATLFTSSTCFANPAVTISRVLTDSGVGIDLYSAILFFVAQLACAFVVAKVVKI